MKISHRVFDWSWRLAVLALPWQTRWFSDASLAGWPWEQARLSFYASWIPMFLFIALSFCHSCGGRNPAQRRSFRFLVPIGVLIVLSALNVFRDHTSLRPILGWWMQIVVLVLFIGALCRMNVSRRSVAMWFVISIIPFALLGCRQFISQQVVGSKWLGIASQLPQTLGVSVVAHDGLRILRAYGGFPHPNIFGGWLAVGAVVATWLAMTSTKRRDNILWIVSASALMSVLVLTFARGAWLAAAVGFVVLFVQQKKIRWIFWIPFIAFAVIFFTQRQHVFARFDLTQRLEQKSVDERVGSLRTGVDLFLKHPFIGTGPNAELLSLATDPQKLLAPLEPPHNAFLLALDDVGIVGFLAIVILCWFIGGTRCDSFLRMYSPLACLFVLALFDHYLWFTWSGQALVAIAVFLSIQPQTDS